MRRILKSLLVILVAACGDDAHAPNRAPASLQIISDLPATGGVGAVVAPFVVRVTDADGEPVTGALVHFAPSLGAARIDPARDSTDGDGLAATTVTLSTTPGPNQIEARVPGVPHVRSVSTVGVVTTARTFSFAPRVLWFQPTIDRRIASVVPRDEYGNVVGGAVTYTSRDPGLVAISAVSETTAELHVVSRPGQTYLVASHGSAVDSVLVAVHDQTSSPCDFLATPVDLTVGASLSFEGSGMACARSSGVGEYLVVGHYNSPLAAATSGFAVVAHGIAATGPGTLGVSVRSTLQAESDFETGLRARERLHMQSWAPVARSWYDTRARMSALSAVTRVGDQVSVNVNAFEFCSKPEDRTARVAALTPGTMILEDTSNPAGGFTTEEYAAIAAMVDTFVVPVSTAAFGEPTDIDDNGRIAILFTGAVNELTPRGAGGVVLGFFYSRDLLPRSGVAGACPGSNTAEMFYVMVPDPDALLGDARTKVYVQGNAISTVAHELQHLINASRRMYVTRTQEIVEETWLNEGLSHIAEELMFYRASGLGPRQNIAGGQLAVGSSVRAMHELFMRGNFGRYAQFLETPQSNSPMAGNDLLATRGASWAFLRYVADRAGAVDGDLWRRLVDGKHTGADNVDAALANTGMTSAGALRDWSTAIALDDIDPGAPPAFSQPSWHFATSMPVLGYRGGPNSLTLRDGQSTSIQVRAGGSAFFRFALDAGREGLVQISSGGGVAPPGMRLTLMRIK